MDTNTGNYGESWNILSEYLENYPQSFIINDRSYLCVPKMARIDTCNAGITRIKAVVPKNQKPIVECKRFSRSTLKTLSADMSEDSCDFSLSAE